MLLVDPASRSRSEMGEDPHEGSDGSRLQWIQMKVCVGTGAAGTDQTYDGLLSCGRYRIFPPGRSSFPGCTEYPAELL